MHSLAFANGKDGEKHKLRELNAWLSKALNTNERTLVLSTTHPTCLVRTVKFIAHALFLR